LVSVFIFFFFGGPSEPGGGKLRWFNCPSGRGGTKLDSNDVEGEMLELRERLLDVVDFGDVDIAGTGDSPVQVSA
jgi:hypothetical protein